MAEIRPRIVGTEMEWAISGRFVGNVEHTQLDNLESLTNTFLDPHIQTTSVGAFGNGSMLSNGSRFYKDVGEHVEYATPEDTTIAGAVTNEWAGERIVLDSLFNYVAGKEKIIETSLRKRVIDDAGMTWGYHMNLSADRKAIPNASDEYLHLLGLHLATSLPMIGGGAIIHPAPDTGEKPFYSFSQKIYGVTTDYTAGTMNMSKGLINQRDEPLASRELYRRIHLTSQDPHISPWATWMALGSCSLILRAIEQGKGADLQLDSNQHENPLLSIALQTSRDMSLHRVRAAIGGKTLGQLDIQSELIEIARTTEHTDEEHEVLEEWERAVDDLMTDPRLLIDRSDAIARRHLIQRQALKHDEDPDDFSRFKALDLDQRYDTLATIKKPISEQADTAKKIYYQSLPFKLRQRQLIGRQVLERDVEQRMFEPPETTRAYERGWAIAGGEVKSAIWTGYTDILGTHDLTDPYRHD